MKDDHSEKSGPTPSSLRRFNDPCAGVGMSLPLMGALVFAARSDYFYQAFRRIQSGSRCGETGPKFKGK